MANVKQKSHIQTKEAQQGLGQTSGERDKDTTISYCSVEERLTYQAPNDPQAARNMDVVISYLKDTLVLDKMTAITQSLAKSSKLPYNPYPVFSHQVISLAEKFNMMKESDDCIQAKLQTPLQSTTSELIYGLQGHTNVWGLKSMVQVIDPESVTKIQKITEKFIPLNIDTAEHDQYTGQILTSIISPLTMLGCFIPRPGNVKIRLDYIIYGKDVDMALDIFASNLILDVEQNMSETSECKLLYVTFTKIQNPRKEVVVKEWMRDRIIDQKEDFKSEIILSTKQICSIKAEVIFCSHDGLDNFFIRGSKEYAVHFIESSSGLQGERLFSYGANPYQTLVEGIFLKKADAEAYVSSMSRHPAVPAKSSPVKLWRKTSNRAGSKVMRTTGGSRQKNESLDELVKKPLRHWFQQMLRGLSEVPGCFRILSISLILILMDRNKYKLESIMDIYRFLQSTSSQFYFASYQNHVIVEFIQTFGLENQSRTILIDLLRQYREDLLRTLNPSLQERPSHHVSYYSYFIYFFDGLEVILKEEDGPRQPLVTKEIIKKFSEFRLFCDTIQYQLTEDALNNLDHFNIKMFLLSCEEQLAPTVGDTSQKTEVLPSVSGQSINAEKSGLQKLILKHGAEPVGIMQQRLQYLSVEDSVKNNNHPVIMAKEGVLMQYLINIRLDDVWANYLKELISAADSLPSNPYPRLVTAMRRAANKMRLMGSRDDLLRNQLLSVKPQVADARLNLFMLPESGVYGLKSALVAVDQDKLKRVLQLADVISDNETISQRGRFQISSGLSITGRTIFYGKTVPYVLKLEVHHHFYIKGPLGTGAEALHLFARLVTDDIKTLKESAIGFVMVALCSDGKEAASVDELDEIKLSTVVLDAASRKQSLYLKLYHAIGWRYVQILKHYRLHFLFIDNADDRHEAYFPENPAEDHKYLFMSRDEAVEYFQKCSQVINTSTREKERLLDEERTKLVQNKKLLPAYETFLVKSLMNNSNNHLADIWRVLHSPASQLEYIMALAESLQELFARCLKFWELEEQPAATSSHVKKGSEVQQTVAEMKGNIHLQTLYRMTLAFYEKVSETMSEPTVFAPSCIQEVLDSKMKNILDFHSSAVILNQKTLTDLEEIRHLLHPLLIATSSEADYITQKPLQTSNQVARHIRILSKK